MTVTNVMFRSTTDQCATHLLKNYLEAIKCSYTWRDCH